MYPPSGARTCWMVAFAALLCCGCGLVPEVRHKEVLHNPFPQMKRVAVLPFFNQSNEPTVDGEQVAEAYYAELQSIPGFEVLPVGVTRNVYLQYSKLYGEPRTGADFQRLAQLMDVEAIVVGSVTDFSAYYPPRMAMTTNWYAANPGFHPIPPGYGLPWGTKGEKRIPSRVVQETEFELARQQLATQTPMPEPAIRIGSPRREVRHADYEQAESDQGGYPDPESLAAGEGQYPEEFDPAVDAGIDMGIGSGIVAAPLPPDWPSPTGLIPDGPQTTPPPMIVQTEPVLTHTRMHRGDDSFFTERLATYVGNNDDGRMGGWQNYLKRSDDFIRFCCHLHLAEMLESRGGRDQSDLILRWPISRY